MLENSKFFLMEPAENNSAMKIHEALLSVKQYGINPGLLLHHRQLLGKGQIARYPFKRSEVKAFTIAAGAQFVSIDNIFTGVMLSNVVFGIVSNAAYTGHAEKNPFYFPHHSNTSVGLYLNSKCCTATPIESNNVLKQYSKAYYNFRKLWKTWY